MTAQVNNDNPTKDEPKLLRRDFILLPALALFTIVVLIAASEMFARKNFVDAETHLAPCLVLNDISTGVRGVPNSRCFAKGSESAWAEYKFNSCGHRAGVECGAKPEGSYRIVMTGSSIAMGLYVPNDKSIAGLLPAELSHATGRTVDVYNTSIGAAYGGTPHSISLRFNEITAAKPDLILWILTPWDIDHASDLKPESDYLAALGNAQGGQPEPASLRASTMHRLAKKIGAESAATALYTDLKQFRFRVLLTHYLYKSRSLYVKAYLMNGDDKIGFLKTEWSPEWKDDLNQFDGYAAQITAQAKDAGIPLVAVLIPNRAQAAMISTGEWPQGYDPSKLDNEVRSSITSHGGNFIDIFPDFRTIPNPESNFMPVDGHPYEEGHAMLAEMIAKHLTAGAVPALKTNAGPNTTQAAAK
jgi:hypothetical protein